MVAPLLVGATLLSAASSVFGGIAGSSAESARRAGLRTQQMWNNVGFSLQKRAIKYETERAVAAGELELKAAGLESRAARYSADGIAAATGAAMFDALLEGEIDANNFEAQAWAAEFNSKVAGQMARHAKESGKIDASDFRRQQGARVANNRAAQAASGFALAGSPMLVDQSIMAEVELGASRLEHAGDVEFFRGLTEQSLLKRESLVFKASADLARKAGAINASYAREAGEISRRAALLGLDSAELHAQSAQLGIVSAKFTGAIQKIGVNIAKGASKAATASGIASSEITGTASIISGFGNAASTIATSGAFG